MAYRTLDFVYKLINLQSIPRLLSIVHDLLLKNKLIGEGDWKGPLTANKLISLQLLSYNVVGWYHDTE